MIILPRRFLLAADGASSGVRKQLHASYTGSSSASQWLIVDAVASSPEAEQLLLQHWANFNFCCGCDTVFVHARTPSTPAHHRWEFLLQGQGALPSSRSLLLRIGVDVSLVHIIREVRATATSALQRILLYSVRFSAAHDDCFQVQYTFHSRIASSWLFQHRVALVGDAAHCMPPFRAQGLATGLHDASNISWKIASVLLGVSTNSLLATYQEERQPHVQAAIAAAEGMGSLICLRRPKLLWHLKNWSFTVVNNLHLYELLFRFFTPNVSVSHGLISPSQSGANATGISLPNYCLSSPDCQRQLFFDEQFWRARRGKLRWCIVVFDIDHELEQHLLCGLPDFFEVVLCHRSSAMQRWLLSLRCRAVLVR
jgi:3-(3-hydroxy-phenyl)propionate hydroxylase